MEAEYVALSMPMRDMFPSKTIGSIQLTGIGLEKKQEFNILCNVFEDNAGTLVCRARTTLNDSKIKTLCSKVPLVLTYLNPENVRVLKIEYQKNN